MGAERKYAGEYIRALLNGYPPNGTAPESFGGYQALIDNLLRAYANGGTPKVREAWREALRRHPALAELVSGDETAPDGWPLYTLADAYQTRPPRTYVVDGLFVLPSLSITYGAPGTIKSLLLADLAVCVAAGLPWLPPLPQASGTAKGTQQAPVLWCDFDNGLRTTHERFAALGRARDLSEHLPLRYTSMPTPWLDAGNVDAMGALARRITRQGAQLVIIDNLSSVKGKADENSAEMGTVMANFRRLTEETGAAVILIHHQRKGKEAAANIRTGDRLRGHSSIEAALDLALLVEREPHASSVTLQSTKVRGVDMPPFGAIFTYAHRPGTTELATARFFGVRVDDTVSDRAIEQAVIEIVTANRQINKSDLTTKVKAALPDIGRHRIAALIGRLETQKKLHTKSGDRGAKLYDLPRQPEAEASPV